MPATLAGFGGHQLSSQADIEYGAADSVAEPMAVV
jgi:hypothetical protein